MLNKSVVCIISTCIGLAQVPAYASNPVIIPPSPTPEYNTQLALLSDLQSYPFELDHRSAQCLSGGVDSVFFCKFWPDNDLFARACLVESQLPRYLNDDTILPIYAQTAAAAIKLYQQAGDFAKADIWTKILIADLKANPRDDHYTGDDALDLVKRWVSLGHISHALDLCKVMFEVPDELIGYAGRDADLIKMLDAIPGAEAKVLKSRVLNAWDSDKRYGTESSHRKPQNNNSVVSDANRPALKAQLQVAFAIDKCITGGDKAGAQKQFKILLKRFDYDAFLKSEAYRSVFLTAINVARKFSDKGWYDLSDQVLDQLQIKLAQDQTKRNGRSIALFAIRLEIAINAQRQVKGADVDEAWQRLLAPIHAISPYSADNQNVRDYVLLDYFGQAFLLGGDYTRAKIALTKAIECARAYKGGDSENALIYQNVDQMSLFAANIATQPQQEASPLVAYACKLMSSTRPSDDNTLVLRFMDVANACEQRGFYRQALDIWQYVLQKESQNRFEIVEWANVKVVDLKMRLGQKIDAPETAVDLLLSGQAWRNAPVIIRLARQLEKDGDRKNAAMAYEKLLRRNIIAFECPMYFDLKGRMDKLMSSK